MKSRILVSMLVIALAAALVGGATMSIFKAEGETDEVTYAAGTVKIKAGNQTFYEIDTLENMAPGDTIYGSFDVANTGTLPLWFTVTAETRGVDGFYNLFDGNFPAVVKIDEYNNILEPGKGTTISFSVHLPIDADNEYQGAKGNLKFKIHAEQLANRDQEPDNRLMHSR